MKNLQLKIVNYWNVQKIGQDNCSSTFNNIYSSSMVCKSQIYKLRENDDCIKLLKKFCCVGNNVITQTGYLGQSIMPLLHLHQKINMPSITLLCFFPYCFLFLPSTKRNYISAYVYQSSKKLVRGVEPLMIIATSFYYQCQSLEYDWFVFKCILHRISDTTNSIITISSYQLKFYPLIRHHTIMLPYMS